MKKLTLLFAFLFTISSSLMSCRGDADRAEGVVDNDYGTEDEVFEDNDIAQTGFDEFDEDEDGFWDQDEFAATYEDDWNTWDADDDDLLDEEEFYTTSYGQVDTDNDGIDRMEWDEGYNNLYGDYANEEDFDTYDLNDNDIIEEDEWTEGWADTGWFDEYDTDGDDLVDTDEWDEGFFNTWDVDNDGFWDQNEYDTYYSYNENW